MSALPTTRLRQVMRCLRATVPVGGVRVVRRQDLGPGLVGLSVMSTENRATIYLRRDLDAEAALDALVHEWAHVLAWRRHGTDIQDHGDEWGIAYAHAFRSLHAELQRRGW